MYNNHTHLEAHTQFGIDDICVHKALDFNLLKKLQRRAEITLDLTDNIVLKYVTYDMILIFHKRIPSQSLIYKFLKLLSQNPDKLSYLESHTLLNEAELFEAIKSKTFALVTYSDLST